MKKFIATDNYEITLEGGSADFESVLSLEHIESGVQIVTLRLTAAAPALPPKLSFTWSCKAIDVQGLWHPAAERSRGLIPDWWEGFTSRSASSAPVVCLYGIRGNNVLSFACSDVMNPLKLHAGLNEETASFHCSVTLFTEPGAPLAFYEALLRLDSRSIPYFQALAGVADWWAGIPGHEPAPVPDTAREPMYSTWYSFHQQLTPEAVEAECRLAAEMGCKAVIVDDGWQTSDAARGYAYCGDWKASAGKISDMKAHVAAVQESGLKYMLWYAVPFIGRHSRVWERFKDKLLYFHEGFGAGVADPRYPEVREYLTGIYEQALLEWNLDGFKLDFVDSFYAIAEDAGRTDGGRDTASVPVAVDLLLGGIINRLRRLKPDILIEFRQSYTGPLMRKYGNMFRAGDCPNDAVQNRIKTIDIRLICGNTAAHSDMLMWNLEESAAGAALQIINVLFAVPQISVRLAELPQSHIEMLTFWLGFWRGHRDVLLEGNLEPWHPELLYPLVMARNSRKLIAAAYLDIVIPLSGELPEEVLVVNGTLLTRLVLELDRDAGQRRVMIRDCQGSTVSQVLAAMGKGIHVLEVPAAGMIAIQAVVT
ncbi:glycoside hydrolase family 36 protein [Paenibacillus tianjinensis]|uniref:Alpha-galactosidase n=1 Tax=Paenibacillus tianjinensis TaxID=2810347 RepID=A0ABX7L6E8_9BACL|nr:glycoside hydrolase family 36 protein [Paenibacillus tianjinensis]QSF42796.1 alpha-galactosidase [Paenibacillus tianjinensis]